MNIDLNLRPRATKPRDRQAFLQRAIELGWDHVAWNTTVNGKIGTEKPLQVVELDTRLTRSALRQRVLVSTLQSFLPKPSNMEFNCQNGNVDDNISLKEIDMHIKQLSRVTIVLEDPLDVHSLGASNEALHAFDLVAVRPTTARALTAICQSADVDIICFDISKKLPFPLNRKVFAEAALKGVHFEICYGPVLENSSTRRDAISGGRAIVECVRGQNIILSSGADSVAGIRGPEDVVCLAHTLGLNKSAAYNALRICSLNALKHGENRRARNLPMQVLFKDDFIKRDQSTLLSEKPLVRKDCRKKRTYSECSKSSNNTDDNDVEYSDVDDKYSKVKINGLNNKGSHELDFLGFK